MAVALGRRQACIWHVWVAVLLELVTTAQAQPAPELAPRATPVILGAPLQIYLMESPIAMRNFIVFTVAFCFVALNSANAQQPFGTPELAAVADARAWRVSHATAEALEVDGKRAIRLTAHGDSATGTVGLALPLGWSFTTGNIEVDLKGKNLRQRSFLGVAFNVIDEKTFEAVYFRPFNFKAEQPFNKRSVQYIAWPDNTWEKLRKGTPDQFENVVNPVPDPDGWFHARIEVTDSQVRVFVNDAKDASLEIARLARGGSDRAVGLFVDSAEGIYANLEITPAPR